MHRSDRNSRTTSRGFALPAVLVALILVAALSGAAQFAAWRAARANRLAWNAERALLGADEAVAISLAQWNAHAFAAQAPGATHNATVTTGDGESARIALTRTAPLSALVEATLRSSVSGSPDTAVRRVLRAISLDPPFIPVRGALTVLGDLQVLGSALIDGRDLLAAGDGCGPGRDSASVNGVHAGNATIAGAAAVNGATPAYQYGIGGTLLLLADRAMAVQGIDTITVRAASEPFTSGSLAPRGPWSPRIVVPADTVTRVVQLSGHSAHDGLMLVRGDLHLHGTLVVRGLLVVEGALDAQGGTLDVQGAVLVLDKRARGSRVGDAARVRYSQCVVRRALSAVSRPSTATWQLWAER